MSRPQTAETKPDTLPTGYMFIDTHQDTFIYAVAPEGREEPT
jgi:hypothetical protein